MQSILYIVPYFGKLPSLFPIWLESCKANPTINWLIITDDDTQYDYPNNVRVEITTFGFIQKKIESSFDFPINIETPYKLCDYKVAYGYIFKEYIQGYDFWGFCDIDLIWGNIRSFLTEDILLKYDKIGYQGHSTIFRNNEQINNLFLESVDGESFEILIASSKNNFIDEDFINRLYDAKKVLMYKEPIFANLSPFVYNFKLNHLKPENKYKNKRFIFSYKDCCLKRLSVVEGRIVEDDFMYVHFLKRKISLNIQDYHNGFMIVPNKIIPYDNLSVSDILEYSKPHFIRFAVRHFFENAHKLSFKTIIPIFYTKIKGYYKLLMKA